MSLRTRLLASLGAAILVLWSAAAVWMLRDLDRGLQRTLDERLAMSARMVAGLLARNALSPGAPVVTARGALTVPGGQGIACQIRTLRGEIVATTSNAGQAPLRATPGYQTTVVGGEAWRTFTLRSGGFDITTADRLEERALLRRRIALAAGVPVLIAALGGLVALWTGIGRALAPLRALQAHLEQRRPDAVDPVPIRSLPAEMRPAIGALNALLERTRRAMEREQGFTGAAAHELRTPLTAIDTHLQVARLTTGDTARQAMADAALGVARLRATLDQLLMLARMDGQRQFDDGERISAGEALDRAIDASGGDPHHRIRRGGDAGTRTLGVPAALAVVALRNLVDNALKYSPPHATVDVVLEQSVEATTYRVLDSGPGMCPGELDRAVERFWRGAGRAKAQGIGLGLALAQAIADRVGGRLALRGREPGGLEAVLVLPNRH